MKIILHKSNTRGHANHGWLNTFHSFSFASFYIPERTHFGKLRVLNDDVLAPGMGFGNHPHSNMEIISIPLEGELKHEDSMGNNHVIRKGDIQVMSAGTGIFHSESNNSKNKEVKFLQIWIFPDKKNVDPRYGQASIDPDDRKNKIQMVVSPQNGNGETWIQQNAWISLGDFDRGIQTNYQLNHPNNGIYLFVIEGSINIMDHKLNRRDAFGIQGFNEIIFTSNSKSELLILEIPI